MDDDFTFGASVWGVEDSTATLSKPTTVLPSFAADDEFEDFGSNQTATTDDDDFGDFGDFDDGPTQQFGDDMGFGEPVAGPSSYGEWEALRLSPMPDREQLERDVDAVLGPLWGQQSLADLTTNDPIREMEGISQILVTPERYDLHTRLARSNVDF